MSDIDYGNGAGIGLAFELTQLILRVYSDFTNSRDSRFLRRKNLYPRKHRL
jgi:hypothetical protein